MPIVIDDLRNNFLNTPLYQGDYYLELLANYQIFGKNITKAKSDDGVYEDLKRKMLSFEVYNPDTKETEVMDLSRYFEEPTVSSKEQYVITKQYRAMCDRKKMLEKKHIVSNRVLKTIDKIREDLQR